jgi:hypothetical protein
VLRIKTDPEGDGWRSHQAGRSYVAYPSVGENTAQRQRVEEIDETGRRPLFARMQPRRQDPSSSIVERASRLVAYRGWVR